MVYLASSVILSLIICLVGVQEVHSYLHVKSSNKIIRPSSTVSSSSLHMLMLETVKIPLQSDTSMYEKLLHKMIDKTDIESAKGRDGKISSIIRWYIAKVEDEHAIIEAVVQSQE